MEVTCSSAYCVDITAPGATKGEAIKKLAEYLGLDRENIMAIGDGLSDVDMFEFAGLKVAVENGVDSIKRAAQHIVAKNVDGGFAQAVYELALKAYDMLEEEMLKKKIWAVAGANHDPEKYGNMIYKKLKAKKYEVYAVNPLYDLVEGDPCYKDLSSLPKMPDVISMVVSPKRGKSIIEEAAGLGIRYIWFQPGTYDDELLEFTQELGLESVQACVLVATR